MKKTFSLMAMLFAMAIVSKAQAQEGFYVGGFAGVNFLDVRPQHHARLNTDTGYTLGATLGYKFYNDFRLEGEVCYRDNSLDNFKFHGEKLNLHGHVKSWSFMANGYYDIPVDCIVTPYVGAGVGYERDSGESRGNFSHAKFKDDGFAWQLMAGANYDLTENVQANLEYKFHQGKQKAYDHAVTLGMKRFF